jgi:hypothetical protein
MTTKRYVVFGSVGLVITALVLGCSKPTYEEALGDMASSLCGRATSCAGGGGKTSDSCAGDVKGDLLTAFNVSESKKDDPSPCTNKELDDCKSAIGSMSCDLFVIEGGRFKISLSNLPSACKCD